MNAKTVARAKDGSETDREYQKGNKGERERGREGIGPLRWLCRLSMAGAKRNLGCVIWESNPGLPDVARMATENFTTKPITLVLDWL